MEKKQRDSTSILVRGAIFAGRVAGTWRHRQLARAQDAFVLLWKEAWVEGCQAGWAGRPGWAPPGTSESQRAAWIAGWTWSRTHPDRRLSRDSSKLGGRRSADGPRPLVRAAKGGAAGLVAFALARWVMKMRRSATNGPRAEPPSE